MQAARLVPILAVLLALIPLQSARAQRGRCPYSAQAQLSIQMQWQPMFTPAPQPPTPAYRPPQVTANQWRGGNRYPMQQFTPRTGGGRTHASGQRSNTSLRGWTPHTSTSTRRTLTLHRTTTHFARFTSHVTSWATHRVYYPYGHRHGFVRHATQYHTFRTWSRYNITRTTFHRTEHLERITQQRLIPTQRTATRIARTVNREPGWQRPDISRQQRPTATQNRNTTVRPRERAVAKKETPTPGVQHRPTVQVRVKMNMTCGTCHGCQSNKQPGIVQQPMSQPPPILVPFPGRPPLIPWQPRLPNPQFVVQPRPAQPPMARIAPPVRPIAVFQPPVLPLLVPDPSPRTGATRMPLPSLLTPTTSPSRESLAGISRPEIPFEKPGRETPRREKSLPPPERMAASTLSAPELPPLQGNAVSVQALPDLPEAPREERTLARTRLDLSALTPDQVEQAPPLPPLPTRPPLGLGLLPALEGNAPSSSTRDTRPLPLDLVYLPPPLPPLPDLAQP